MKALLKTPGSPAAVCVVPAPLGEILIRVQWVGLCRTDLRVATGEIAIQSPTILGHEFSGVVEGGSLDGVSVVVDPLIDGAFMGLARDGAISEYVAVPACNVYRLPAGLSLQVGAYVEPVAASMAVLKARIKKSARGAVAGVGRIADLTRLILDTEGYNVEVFSGDIGYDYIIETSMVDATPYVNSLRHGGLLVIKSRSYTPAMLPLAAIVAKEIQISGVNYASYPTALAWMVRNSEALSEYIGNVYSMDQHERAFAEALDCEQTKVFIKVS